MLKQKIQTVEKPWGYELIWSHTKTYAGKVIHIRKGHQLSLQYHQEKEESIFVYSGSMHLILENDQGDLETILLNAGEAHHIPVKRKHRMIALEECEILEVSTPQLNDVVRLEDSYGRVSE